MSLVIAITAGALFGLGTFLALQRSLLRSLMGVGLLVNGVNLVLFASGGLTRARAPILEPGEVALPRDVADPLPQALVLTSIIITFGVQAFGLVLAAELGRSLGTDDADAARRTDSASERGKDGGPDA